MVRHDQLKSEENQIGYFLKIVNKGRTQISYFPLDRPDHAAMHVTVTITDTEIILKTRYFDKTTIPIRSLYSAVYGKNSNRTNDSYYDPAISSRCFSLVGRNNELYDFEASSREEAQAMFEGFLLLLKVDAQRRLFEESGVEYDPQAPPIVPVEAMDTVAAASLDKLYQKRRAPNSSETRFENDVLTSFVRLLLAGGSEVFYHRGGAKKKPYTAKLSGADDLLEVDIMNHGKYAFPLNEIVEVREGQSTSSFQSLPYANSIDASKCFSLILPFNSKLGKTLGTLEDGSGGRVVMANASNMANASFAGAGMDFVPNGVTKSRFSAAGAPQMGDLQRNGSTESKNGGDFNKVYAINLECQNFQQCQAIATGIAMAVDRVKYELAHGMPVDGGTQALKRFIKRALTYENKKSPLYHLRNFVCNCNVHVDEDEVGPDYMV